MRSVLRSRVRNLDLSQGPSTKTSSCTRHDVEAPETERIRDPLRIPFGPQLQFLGGQALPKKEEVRAT